MSGVLPQAAAANFRKGNRPSCVALMHASQFIARTIELPMWSTTDKAKGAANQAAGALKQGVGEAVASKKLQAEGATQKAKGKAQEVVDKAKDLLKSVVDTA